MDITKKTVEELKVIAYDLGMNLAQTRQNLQIIEQEIAKRSEPKTDGKKSK
ncbi:MAG: hypothetical protein HOE30_08510 [Deltaproteobacteria bacterium]|jgi:hypothetical protein|nr:hypothetical protein [Deltaproteobacteria bacterium]